MMNADLIIFNQGVDQNYFFSVFIHDEDGFIPMFNNNGGEYPRHMRLEFSPASKMYKKKNRIF